MAQVADPYDPMTEPEGFRAYKAGIAAGRAEERQRIRDGSVRRNGPQMLGLDYYAVPADLLADD